jgi:DNA-binding MarR family transcriptional regulator
VIDRLEHAGYARRARDPDDRRKVSVGVTPEFYAAADKLWGPLKQDWDTVLARRFTGEQLDAVIDFLRATNEVTARHIDRVGSERSASGS